MKNFWQGFEKRANAISQNAPAPNMPAIGVKPDVNTGMSPTTPVEGVMPVKNVGTGGGMNE